MHDTTALQPLIDHALKDLQPAARTPDADAMARHHDRLLETLGEVTDALVNAFSRAAEDQLRTAADALDTLYRGRRDNPRLRRHPGHLFQGRSRGQLETQRNIVHVNAIGARTQIVEFAEADIARLHRLIRDFEVARADWTRLLAAADTPAKRVAALQGWTIADRALQTLGTHLSALARETTMGIADELAAAYRLADTLIDRAFDVTDPTFVSEAKGTHQALRARAAKLAQGARWLRKANSAIREAEPHNHQLRLAMAGIASSQGFSLTTPPQAQVMLRRQTRAESGGHHRETGDSSAGEGALLGAAVAATAVSCGDSCSGGGD